MCTKEKLAYTMFKFKVIRVVTFPISYLTIVLLSDVLKSYSFLNTMINLSFKFHKKVIWPSLLF